MALNHARIKMACSTSGDLLHWESETSEAGSVVVRLNISGQYGCAFIPRQTFQSALEQARLARTRGANQVKAENAVLLKARAQLARDALVFTKNFPLQRHSVHIPPPPNRPDPVRRRRYTRRAHCCIADNGSRSPGRQILVRNPGNGDAEGRLQLPAAATRDQFCG